MHEGVFAQMLAQPRVHRKIAYRSAIALLWRSVLLPGQRAGAAGEDGAGSPMSRARMAASQSRPCRPGSPTESVQVMPATSATPGGTRSMRTRTGTRCASRTQV